MFNKRGLSTVISVMILVMLVVSLVAIVWGVVHNLVTKNIQGSESCFGNFDKVEIESQYTYFDPNTNKFQFSISLKDIDVEKVIVAITSKSGTRTYTINNSNQTIPKLSTYPTIPTVKLPEKNTGSTYIASGFSEKPESIKIAPIINGEQCEVSDSLNEVLTGIISTSSYGCTGTIPANAGAYDTEESTGLTANTPWVYSATDTSTKCQFTCTQGSWNGTACVVSGYSCTGTIPANAGAYDAEESTGLTANTPWTYSATDTSTKCQFTCTQGSWNGTACVSSCTETCSSGPGCKSSLTNGHTTTGVCCGTGESCYTCNSGYSWNGNSCISSGFSDTTNPVVNVFSIAPTSLTTGNEVTASYTVTDNVGLSRVELWSAPNDNGNPGTWSKVSESIVSGLSYTGTLIDNDVTQTSWYGLHVVDSSGNIGFEPNPPGPIRVDKLVMLDVEYKPGLGLDCKLASGQGKKPVFVYLNGGGWNFGSKSDSQDDFIDGLVNEGISVVRVDYSKTVPELNIAQGIYPNPYSSQVNRYPRALLDVDCALKWIVKNSNNYNFDTSKIYLGGYSAGAHISLLYSINQGDYYDATCPNSGFNVNLKKIVSIAGPTNLVTLNLPSEYSSLIPAFVSSALRSTASPINYVSSNNGKDYLLINSRQDTFVDFDTQAINFYYLMKSQGYQIDGKWYDSGDHNFGYLNSQDLFINIKNFLINGLSSSSPTYTTCISSYCVGFNNIVFGINGAGKYCTATCTGSWWSDLRGNSWTSNCNTNWIDLNNCN